MIRYVDPKWLYENVKEQAPQYAEAIKDLMLVAPSIDIVRCRECTERDDDWCMYFGKMINPDDFCSYGERNDNGF